MNIDNNIGKIDVFNTLYEVQNFAYLNNFLINRDNISYSDIFENIDKSNINKLQILLSNNDNVDIIQNKYNIAGDTILHYITYKFIKHNNSNYYEIFKFLSKNYIDINKKNLYGYSILYGVCKYHDINIDLIKFLLEHGANPNLTIENTSYSSPFSYICVKFYNITLYQTYKIDLFLNIIKEMIRYGGNIDEKIIVKRIIDIRMELGSFSPYITKNEEITISDLFNEIDPKYKTIVLKCHHDYIFNKRLNFLLLIEGCDKNYRLPIIFENEDFIKELCSFI